MDPITAFGVATTAFNAIKKGFQVGRDVESMSKDLGRWMGAIQDVKDDMTQLMQRFDRLESKIDDMIRRQANG